MRECGCPSARRALGGIVGTVGLALLGVGLWARRDVRRGLERERISMALGPGAESRQIRTSADERWLAELIRSQTVEAAGGRIYSETDQFLAADGATTSDRSLAAVDERTGLPVPNPDYALWINSTALQIALTQASLAYRLADLASGLGATFVAVGAGLAARR